MSETPELKQLADLLGRKIPLTAMLAPSFTIDFSYPEVVGKLKRAGFKYVVEVARGAIETNRQVIEDLKNNPKKRIITSPCPSCVGYIRAQRPELAPFLSKADSPMTASAKLVEKIFPGTKPVFIGPCLTKKLEAKEFADLGILVLTFKELADFFTKIQLADSDEDLKARFDLLGPHTRLYPISGGLCQSAGIKELLADDDFQMVSGLENLKTALDDFVNNKNIRLLDILFCHGGCINGPGIVSQDSIEIRRNRIVKFWSSHPGVK